MEVQSLVMSDTEKKIRKLEKESFQHETTLNFLKSHNGHRNGKTHIYLGVSGAGKSTLLRTLARDWLLNNTFGTMGLWLSEESLEDLKDEIAQIDDESIPWGRVKVLSEMDMVKLDAKQMAERLKDFVLKDRVDILFFDNITTSNMYAGKRPDIQEKVQDWIKVLCSESDIPFIFFAHTDGLVNDGIKRLIEMNDIRGNKGLVNLAQFFYIMQRFEIDKLFFPTLRVRKYRGYSVEDRLFYLNYDKESSTFHSDHKLPWDEFNLAYKKRNLL